MAILALMVDDVAVSKFELPLGKVRLGRNVDNDVHIDDLAVSGYHAQINVTEDPYMEGSLRYQLEDLGSTNTTQVNHQAMSQAVLLKNGDSIQIGYNHFKFINDLSPDLEKTSVILPENKLD